MNKHQIAAEYWKKIEDYQHGRTNEGWLSEAHIIESAIEKATEVHNRQIQELEQERSSLRKALSDHHEELCEAEKVISQLQAPEMRLAAQAARATESDSMVAARFAKEAGDVDAQGQEWTPEYVKQLLGVSWDSGWWNCIADAHNAVMHQAHQEKEMK